jgi:hypothetical protein
MKSRRMKITVAILGILVAALIFNAFYTWGIIFDHDGGFEWSGTYIFEDILSEKGSARVRLGVNPNNPIFCIPLVFWVYGIESPPYGILLNINDETESLEKIFIELMSIEYTDGRKIEHPIDWNRRFESTLIYRSIDSKLFGIPVKQLIDKLPVTVDRRRSCNIRFVGWFVDREGNKIAFETTEYFEYEPCTWRIYPARGSF